MPRIAASHASRTYAPSSADGQVIAEFARVLDEAGPSAATGRPPVIIAPDGRHLAVPEEIYPILLQVAAALASGMDVSVAPLSAMLTTQEAAEYLGVSRPTLVRILERGEIPTEKPGRHRLVRLQDLVDFQQRRAATRRDALTAMVAEAEEDDLYARTDQPAPATR